MKYMKNGYKVVRVASDHPLAIVANGQKNFWVAYEHQLVASKAANVDVRGKAVHHRNEVRTDNRVENLIIFDSRASHQSYHRKRQSGKSEAQALAEVGHERMTILDPHLDLKVWVLTRHLRVNEALKKIEGVFNAA